MRFLHSLALAPILVLALALAVPASADRVVSEIAIPGSSGALFEPGSLAMRSNGEFAFTWAEKGWIHLARYQQGRWHSRALARVHGNAGPTVAFDGEGKPVVGWADRRGAWVMTGADVSPARLSRDKLGSVAVIRTKGGQLLAVSAAGHGKPRKITIFLRDGRVWKVVRRLSTNSSWDITPWGRNGYALLLSGGRSKLVIEIHAGPATKGIRYQARVELLAGSIVRLPDGSLGVLYGGRWSGGRRDNLMYTVLRDGRFRTRVIYANLQCDIGAIGIGRVGKEIRLAYGYGCDVGWFLHTVAGKVAYNPFAGNRDSYMSSPQGFASTGGRIAFVHRNTKQKRLSIRVIGP